MKSYKQAPTLESATEMLQKVHIIHALTREVQSAVITRFALSSRQGRQADALPKHGRSLLLEAQNALWNEFQAPDPFEDGAEAPALTPVPALPARGNRGNAVDMTFEQHRALAERLRLMKKLSLEVSIWSANHRLPNAPKLRPEAQKANKSINELASALDDDWCRLLVRDDPGSQNDFPYYGAEEARAAR